MEKGVLIFGEIEKVEITEKVDLIITSPPYGIGKTYESFQTIESYKSWAEMVIIKLKTLLNPNGAVCWQVGTHAGDSGDYLPLDILYVPIFQKHGFILKNRIIWKFGSGLHSNNRLSGRYETLLWFVLDAKNYTFNLDPIRIDSKEPGKRAYKGPNKGNFSGNPLGKNPSDIWNIMIDEWESGEWNFPNVKSNHVENTRNILVNFQLNWQNVVFWPFQTKMIQFLIHLLEQGARGVRLYFTIESLLGLIKKSSFWKLRKHDFKKHLMER